MHRSYLDFVDTLYITRNEKLYLVHHYIVCTNVHKQFYTDVCGLIGVQTKIQLIRAPKCFHLKLNEKF